MLLVTPEYEEQMAGTCAASSHVRFGFSAISLCGSLQIEMVRIIQCNMEFLVWKSLAIKHQTFRAHVHPYFSSETVPGN